MLLSHWDNALWSSSMPLSNLGSMDKAVGTLAKAMLTTPVRHPLGATVREIRDFFDDDHVHAALIVGPTGYLASVVERGDITQGQVAEATAAPLGRLAGRTVSEDASLIEIQRAMNAAGRRRAAVISADGRLLGLLCLKASRAGFCSEDDVRARALTDRRGPGRRHQRPLPVGRGRGYRRQLRPAQRTRRPGSGPPRFTPPARPEQDRQAVGHGPPQLDLGRHDGLAILAVSPVVIRSAARRGSMSQGA
jgi:hypothetical protein